MLLKYYAYAHISFNKLTNLRKTKMHITYYQAHRQAQLLKYNCTIELN